VVTSAGYTPWEHQLAEQNLATAEARVAATAPEWGGAILAQSTKPVGVAAHWTPSPSAAGEGRSKRPQFIQ
jgi:hypothetical protein